MQAWPVDSPGDSCYPGTEGRHWQAAALAQPADRLQFLGEWQPLLSEDQPSNTSKASAVDLKMTSEAWSPAATAGGVDLLKPAVSRVLRTANAVSTPRSVCAVNGPRNACASSAANQSSFQAGCHLEASTSLGVCHSLLCIRLTRCRWTCWQRMQQRAAILPLAFGAPLLCSHVQTSLT